MIWPKEGVLATGPAAPPGTRYFDSIRGALAPVDDGEASEETAPSSLPLPPGPDSSRKDPSPGDSQGPPAAARTPDFTLCLTTACIVAPCRFSTRQLQIGHFAKAGAHDLHAHRCPHGISSTVWGISRHTMHRSSSICKDGEMGGCC